MNRRFLCAGKFPLHPVESRLTERCRECISRMQSRCEPNARWKTNVKLKWRFTTSLHSSARVDAWVNMLLCPQVIWQLFIWIYNCTLVLTPVHRLNDDTIVPVFKAPQPYTASLISASGSRSVPAPARGFVAFCVLKNIHQYGEKLSTCLGWSLSWCSDLRLVG